MNNKKVNNNKATKNNAKNTGGRKSVERRSPPGESPLSVQHITATVNANDDYVINEKGGVVLSDCNDTITNDATGKSGDVVTAKGGDVNKLKKQVTFIADELDKQATLPAVESDNKKQGMDGKKCDKQTVCQLKTLALEPLITSE